MADKPIGQHWRDGAIYFDTGRSEEESLEYIRSMPKYVLSILREALEDTDPFKVDKGGEASEANAIVAEAAPLSYGSESNLVGGRVGGSGSPRNAL